MEQTSMQEELELAVLRATLMKHHVDVSGLSMELYKGLVSDRWNSGAGFVTSIDVSKQINFFDKNINENISDELALLNDETRPVGFMIKIKNGRIESIEGYTFGYVDWPKNIYKFRLVDSVSGT